MKVKDWTGSPSLTIGYKLDDYNSLSIKWGWARYSLSRSFTATALLFAVTSVDGSASVLIGGGPLDIDIDWKSDAANLELEYQRKLWSGKSGAVLGLGLRYRYESQEFDGTTASGAFRFDATHEKLREHLYGPYTGLKLSFKPAVDSKLGITLETSVGWLFKNAELRAQNTFPVPFPPFFVSFARNDNSSKGTVFTDVGLNFLYSISKNLFVDVGYNLNWIHNAAHISSAFNANIFGNGVPARVVDSAVRTNSIGFTVFYRF